MGEVAVSRALLAVRIGIGLAAVCVVIALFTTFDTIEVDGAGCGSPANPVEPAPDGCQAKLDHTEGTRTAALAWAVVILAASWAVDVGRRGARGAPAERPSTRHLAPSVPIDDVLTFELSASARRVRWIAVILIGWAAVFLASALAAGDGGRIALALLWAAATAVMSAHLLLRLPTRVNAHADRLEFVSRTRQVDVPWAQLRSVEGAWGADRLTWRWDGGKLNTTGPWQRQHVLLTLVEQRAPGAQLKDL